MECEKTMNEERFRVFENVVQSMKRQIEELEVEKSAALGEVAASKVEVRI